MKKYKIKGNEVRMFYELDLSKLDPINGLTQYNIRKKCEDQLGISITSLGNKINVILPQPSDNGELRIYEYAFENSSIHHVYGLEYVTYIGDRAFKCSTLESGYYDDVGSYHRNDCLDLSSVIEFDGGYNFEECYGIRGFKFNKELETIPTGFAYNSYNVRSVYDTYNVKYIGEEAFYNTKIENINVYYDCELYESSIYNEDEKKVTLFLCGYPLDLSNADPYYDINKEYIQELVNEQNQYLDTNGLPFSKEIRSVCVTLPKPNDDGDLIIHEYAFSDIGVSKMIGCNKITQIGDFAFSGSYSKYYNFINQEIFLDSCTIIGMGAFRGCMLKSVVLNSLLENIPIMCFNECTNLEKVYGLNKITIIGDYAFANCTSLSGKIFIDSCDELGANSFENSGINEVVLSPEILKDIPNYCFYNCTKLEKVYGLNNMLSIGNYAFVNCAISGKIYINDTTLKGSFKGCKNIQSVVLSPYTYLYDGCFMGCENLESVYNLHKVKFIGDNVFNGCTLLSGNLYLNNASFDSDENIELTSVNVFKDCKNIKAVTLPSNHNTISTGMFMGCENLERIYNLNKCYKIRKNAFNGCTSLSGKIYIDSCSLIQKGAFKDCVNIEEVVLAPNCVIQEEAFDNCTSLNRVFNLNKAAIILENAFRNCWLQGKLYVESCTDLRLFAFVGCDNVDEIVVGSSAYKQMLANNTYPNLNELVWGPINCTWHLIRHI